MQKCSFNLELKSAAKFCNGYFFCSRMIFWNIICLEIFFRFESYLMKGHFCGTDFKIFSEYCEIFFCRKVGPGKVVCGGKSWGLGEPTVCASISSAITSLSCFHISYYHYRNLNCFWKSSYHKYKLFVSHHQFNNYHNNVRQIKLIMQNWPHSWRD